MSRRDLLRGVSVALRRKEVVVAAALTVATLALALAERAWPSEGEWMAPLSGLLRYTAVAALLASAFAVFAALVRPRVSRSSRLAETGVAAAIGGAFVAIAVFAWPPLDRYETATNYVPPPLPWLAPTAEEEREAEATRRIRRVRKEVRALGDEARGPLTLDEVIDAVVAAGAIPYLDTFDAERRAVVFEVQDELAEPTLALAVLANPGSAASYAGGSTRTQGCGEGRRRANVVLVPLRCTAVDARQLSRVADGLARPLEDRPTS